MMNKAEGHSPGIRGLIVADDDPCRSGLASPLAEQPDIAVVAGSKWSLWRGTGVRATAACDAVRRG